MDLLLPIVVALSTTSDDNVYLTSFLVEGTSFRKVVAGELLGFTSLVLLSLLISQSLPHINLLGLIPISIGLYKMMGLLGAGTENRKGSSILAVYLVNVSNGGNNLAVFIPLFAAVNPVPIIITCYLSIFVWLYLSKVLSGNAALLLNQFYLYKLVPFFYIGIGIKIIFL